MKAGASSGARLTPHSPPSKPPRVIRLLVFVVVSVCSLFAQEQLNPPIAVALPPPPPGPSLVAVAQNAAAIRDFEEDPAITGPMVDALLRTLTGKSDTASAWRTIAGPGDRFGIKVTCAGGPLFSTRRGVVAAVVAGLQSAGVKTIIVWDKSAASLRQCGFTPERLGCEVRGIEPPRGWDRTAIFTAPVLGKIIWGDLLFAEKTAKQYSDPLSAKSYLCTILSRDVTKFINLPALSDEPGLGVAGALHSAVIGNLDNTRRFSSFSEGGASALPELYADPRIGGKCVLHILDALLVTFAGGPSANPQNSTPHGALYASRDPLALDATALRLMEKWRAAAKLGPIGSKAAWIAESTFGHADETMIQLQPVR